MRPIPFIHSFLKKRKESGAVSLVFYIRAPALKEASSQPAAFGAWCCNSSSAPSSHKAPSKSPPAGLRETGRDWETMWETDVETERWASRSRVACCLHQRCLLTITAVSSFASDRHHHRPARWARCPPRCPLTPHHSSPSSGRLHSSAYATPVRVLYSRGGSAAAASSNAIVTWLPPGGLLPVDGSSFSRR